MCRWLLLGIIVLGTVAVVLGKPPRGYDSRYTREVQPMADKIWVSTTGDMNAAASYSPSGVPGAADNLMFTGPDGGGSNQSATINTDALSGVALNEVQVTPTYTGDLGTVGSSLRIGAVTTPMIYQGQGTLYFGSVAAVILIVDSANTVLAAHISSATTLYLRRGYVTYAGGLTASGCYVSQWRDATSTLEFQGSTGNLGNFHVSGGLVLSSRPQPAGVVQLAGGTWIQNRDGGAMLNVEMSGGTLIYNTTGTLSLLSVNSGLADFSEDRRVKTVTTMVLQPGAQYIENNLMAVGDLYDLRGPVPTIK